MALLQSLTDLIHASEQMSVYVLFILLQVPTVDSMEYSVVNSCNYRTIQILGQQYSGTFGTEVTISASVVGGSGSVVVTDNNITVTGLSYTGSHTVRVVATSAVCPGVDNSNTDVPVMFNIRSEWNIPPELFLYHTFNNLLSNGTESVDWIH